MGGRHQVGYPQVPHSQQLEEQAHTNYENRYSWMENSNGANRQRPTHDVPVHSNTTANRAVAQDPQISNLRPDPRTKQTEAQMSQEAYRASATQVPLGPSSERSDPPHSAHALDVKPSEKGPQDGPIEPDANPLTPTLPSYSSKQERRNTNMGILAPPNTDFVATSYQPATQPVRGGSWQHSLCSCFDPSVCLTGLFCPCILYGKVQYRLSLKSDRKDGTNMLGYKAVNGSCVAWTLLCGINGLLSGIQKTRVRRSYEMDQGSGNLFSDCLAGCCCCCCVLAQNEKEMKHREEGTRRAGLSQQEGYVPPGGMTFSQQ